MVSISKTTTYFTRVNVSVSVQGPFTVETELVKKRRPGLPDRILWINLAP